MIEMLLGMRTGSMLPNFVDFADVVDFYVFSFFVFSGQLL